MVALLSPYRSNSGGAKAARTRETKRNQRSRCPILTSDLKHCRRSHPSYRAAQAFSHGRPRVLPHRLTPSASRSRYRPRPPAGPHPAFTQRWLSCPGSDATAAVSRSPGGRARSGGATAANPSASPGAGGGGSARGATASPGAVWRREGAARGTPGLVVPWVWGGREPARSGGRRTTAPSMRGGGALRHRDALEGPPPPLRRRSSRRAVKRRGRCRRRLALGSPGFPRSPGWAAELPPPFLGGQRAAMRGAASSSP